MVPYTTMDSVTAMIVLSAPLPDSLPLTDESALLVSYSFSDGVPTLTNSTRSLASFDFATDASGVIISWEVDAEGPHASIATFNTNIPGLVAVDLGINEGNAEGSVTGEPGIWSPAVIGSVPEPGALSMMFSGLLGLGLIAGVERCRGNHLATEA